jgi:tRNA (cmo5U34)-methyltransferase
MRDSIYAQPRDGIAGFVFDENVAAVFPDMIRRSVPGYAEVIGLTGVAATQYARAGTQCYDLGCSLGATTMALRRAITQPDVRIIAVDNSAAMIDRCGMNLAREPSPVRVELRCADIRDVVIENASLVAMTFTLQFIPPSDRQDLANRIAAGLHPGGVFLLAEKVVAQDAAEQECLEGLHCAFKRANGYSELEISQKRAALENVLIPETVEAHKERLYRAGFSRVHLVFRSLNFITLLALR